MVGGESMTPIIFGESVIGYSHLTHDKPKQDNYLVIDENTKSSVKSRIKKYQSCYLNLPNDIRIVAVSDGHGSNSCPYSDKGSQMAVNTFCDIMAYYAEKYSSDSEKNISDLFMLLNREGEAATLVKEIVTEWGNRVLKYHKLNPDVNKEPFEVDGKSNEAKIWKQYGATLLGMLISDDYIFTLQLGDGDITFINDSTIEPVVEPEKILGVETHSISKRKSWEKAVTKVLRLEKVEHPSMFLLSTDGFVNSHASEEEFYKTCKAYFDLSNEKGYEVIKNNLGDWLSDTSKNGCGDDITAVFVYYKV